MFQSKVCFVSLSTYDNSDSGDQIDFIWLENTKCVIYRGENNQVQAMSCNYGNGECK